MGRGRRTEAAVRDASPTAREGSFGRRVAAYTIDVALLFVVLAPLGLLVNRLVGAPTAMTGMDVWLTILWNFSLPVWIYFTVADRSRSGATLAKRWLGLRVVGPRGERLGTPIALLRTGVKLLPWELAHVASFALSTDLSTFDVRQIVGTSAAVLLTLAYLGVTAATRGRQSVHDLVTGTAVVRVVRRTEGAGAGASTLTASSPP